MKAILLHHAGGDKYAYRHLQQSLLPEISGVAIELPGRGDRFSEPLLYSIEEMLEDVFRQINNELTEEYILVGMSMGAVLAFLLTHWLNEKNLPMPSAVFLASRLPFTHYETRENLAEWSSDAFWEFIVAYDARSATIAAHAELRELVEPVLRADFSAMQHFDRKFTGLVPLQVPCYIMNGKEDVKLYDATRIKEWNNYFAGTVEYSLFDGGHFFLYENDEVAAYIKSSMKGEK
ncbi:MAG: alpha/beta fold hydrolase [Chitinophagales bacterium]